MSLKCRSNHHYISSLTSPGDELALWLHSDEMMVLFILFEQWETGGQRVVGRERVCMWLTVGILLPCRLPCPLLQFERPVRRWDTTLPVGEIVSTKTWRSSHTRPPCEVTLWSHLVKSPADTRITWHVRRHRCFTVSTSHSWPVPTHYTPDPPSSHTIVTPLVCVTFLFVLLSHAGTLLVKRHLPASLHLQQNCVFTRKDRSQCLLIWNNRKQSRSKLQTSGCILISTLWTFWD